VRGLVVSIEHGWNFFENMILKISFGLRIQNPTDSLEKSKWRGALTFASFTE
jgi:hypothetical protein